MSPYPKIYLYRRIVQAKLFIDEHFAGDINLNAIAGEAYFSKFHFTRLFKKIYNKTPHQYLTGVRIEKAKQLLSGGIPVSEACFEVGFSSVSSFNGLFKKAVLLTPSAYRSAQLERKKEIEATPLKFIPNCFIEKKGWTKNSNIQEVIF